MRTTIIIPRSGALALTPLITSATCRYKRPPSVSHTHIRYAVVRSQSILPGGKRAGDRSIDRLLAIASGIIDKGNAIVWKGRSRAVSDEVTRWFDLVCAFG